MGSGSRSGRRCAQAYTVVMARCAAPARRPPSRARYGHGIAGHSRAVRYQARRLGGGGGEYHRVEGACHPQASPGQGRVARRADPLACAHPGALAVQPAAAASGTGAQVDARQQQVGATTRPPNSASCSTRRNTWPLAAGPGCSAPTRTAGRSVRRCTRGGRRWHRSATVACGRTGKAAQLPGMGWRSSDHSVGQRPAARAGNARPARPGRGPVGQVQAVAVGKLQASGRRSRAVSRSTPTRRIRRSVSV